MSQNQSYYWYTTRHNVYLKRTAKFHLLMALIAALTFTTVCLAELKPSFNEDRASILTPTKVDAEDLKFPKAEILNSAVNEIPSSYATTEDTKAKAGFIDAFTASISVILFTELGDKTFFIAAIMAMRHPRLIVFSGAIFALALMTILSVVFGIAATIIPKIYTYYISTALFAIFGLKMIYDGYVMKSTDAQEEMEEVQSDLRKREDELLRAAHDRPEDSESKRKNSNSDKEEDVDELERVSVSLVQDPESGVGRKNSKRSATYLTTRVFMQAFTMTFLAEWGDRSQLTTIILAASKDVYGVIVGGILGHSICTGLAVIGGRMVAAKISVRVVTIVGGVVFLGFAVYALICKPDDL